MFLQGVHIMKKLLIAVMAVAAVMGASSQVSAKRDAVAVPPSSEYEYFCHRSNSASNPYTKVPFSSTYSEVDGQGQNDHTKHTGPVVSTQAEAEALKDDHKKWGDIIPPVSPFLVNGFNWDAEGQAVYNNDCNYPPVVDPDVANVQYTVACNEAKTGIVVTLTNTDEVSGSITVNGEKIVVAAGATVTRNFSDGTQITIVLDGETTPDYDQQVMCQVGGSGGGSAPTPQEVMAAQLPDTAGTNYALLLGAVSASVVAASIGGKRLFARFL